MNDSSREHELVILKRRKTSNQETSKKNAQPYKNKLKK